MIVAARRKQSVNVVRPRQVRLAVTSSCRAKLSMKQRTFLSEHSVCRFQSDLLLSVLSTPHTTHTNHNVMLSDALAVCVFTFTPIKTFFHQKRVFSLLCRFLLFLCVVLSLCVVRLVSFILFFLRFCFSAVTETLSCSVLYCGRIRGSVQR